MKLCNFTTGVTGELTKIRHNSSIKYVISPLNIAVKLDVLSVICGDFLEMELYNNIMNFFKKAEITVKVHI